MSESIRVFRQYLLLVVKLILLSWIFLPIFIIFSVVSKIKAESFFRKEKILAYLNMHKKEIRGLGNHRIYNLDIEKIRKGVSNLVWKQTFSFDGGRRITLVGKKFLPFGSIITFISSLCGPLPKRIPMTMRRRFRQEVDALRILKSNGVYTPEVFFSDERQKVILMEHIPGLDAGDFMEQLGSEKEITQEEADFFRNCGRSLAMLHGHGLSLISHNDRSRIFERANNRIYFVDFEMSTLNDYRAWDMAIFIHWTRVKLGCQNKQKTGMVEQMFFDGYKTLLFCKLNS